MTARITTGFTLIELMIVVAIVAILAAVAYPSYQAQVRKGRLGQAQADMLELAQFMERCFAANNTYANCNLPFDGSPRNGTRYYDIRLQTPSRTEFDLTATPLSAGGQDQHPCGVLTLDERNVKGFAPTGTQAQCW